MNEFAKIERREGTDSAPESLHPFSGTAPRFFVFGPAPHGFDREQLQASLHAPYDAIILNRPVGAAEFEDAVAAAADPALPVADLAGNTHLRRDFTGEALDPGCPDAVLKHFSPIWKRLAAFPYRSPDMGAEEMLILRLAYSRAAPIAAVLDPAARGLVRYPLLGARADLRGELENLTEYGLLRRSHFMRTHGCRKCDSARLHAYEACPSCGSSDLQDEAIVHHYRCGAQEAESHFTNGHRLICPKCHDELRHYGVDYDKPGHIVSCRACGAANSEPDPAFICLDCAAVTAGGDLSQKDWYHYELTEEGLQALQSNHLPLLDITAYVNGRPRVFSLRDFLLLVSEGMRIMRRFERSFALGRIAISNLEELRETRSVTEISLAFRQAVDTILDGMHDCDFVGADGTAAILIGFRETTAAQAEIALARLRAKVAEAVPLSFAIETSADEGENILDFLVRKENELADE